MHIDSDDVKDVKVLPFFFSVSIIFTFSCSGSVSYFIFYKSVFSPSPGCLQVMTDSNGGAAEGKGQ